jgi:hypothetical protein
VRVCSICHKSGHNKATCKITFEKNSVPILQEKPKDKEKLLGHAILEEKKKVEERIVVNGVPPQKN